MNERFGSTPTGGKDPGLYRDANEQEIDPVRCLMGDWSYGVCRWQVPKLPPVKIILRSEIVITVAFWKQW